MNGFSIDIMGLERYYPSELVNDSGQRKNMA